jgi:hypothetical protein
MKKKPQARSQKLEAWRSRQRVCAVLLASGSWLLASLPLPAQPTQEEVFKSIGDNVNRPVDSKRILAVAAGIAGVVVLLVVVGQWRKRETTSRALNHHGKLMKEVLRNVSLKGAEVKQLKVLAQDLRPRGTDQRIESPLVLLLCPTLLGEAAKQNKAKADLPVIAGLVKRLVSKP